MAPQISRCVDKLTAHFDRLIANKGGKIDMKKSAMGFTINVISSCAFAAEIDANGEENTNKVHPVVHHGIKAFEVDPLRFFVILLLPVSFDQFLQKHNLGSSVQAFNFFIDLIVEVVKKRKETNLGNHDLIQLMMDAYVDDSVLKKFDFNKLAASMDIEFDGKFHCYDFESED